MSKGMIHMFIPGETITQTIYMPFLSSEVSKVLVSYKQFNRIVLTKEIISGFENVENRTASCKFKINLTQQESLQFFDSEIYTIQLNVILENGNRISSVEMQDITGKQHYKEIYT